MNVTAFTISLNVDDVPASSDFLRRHFGFVETMAAEGVASLSRPEGGMSIVYLQRGNPYLPASFRDRTADGIILAFTVEHLQREEERLRAEGVPITLPLQQEDWGERLFQVTDPNGIVIQLLDWVEPS